MTQFRVVEQYGVFCEGTTAIRWLIQHRPHESAPWETAGITHDIEVMKLAKHHIENYGALERTFPITPKGTP